MADATMKIDLTGFQTKHLELPNGNIEISLGHKAINANDAARLVAPVYKYLNDMKKNHIAPVISRFDANVGAAETAEEAAKLEKQVNALLTSAIDGLKKEATKRLTAAWETKKKENKALLKFKVKIGAKVTWGVVKIGRSIAKLVATKGTKADEYVKIFKACVAIAKELKKALKSETSARADLVAALSGMEAATTNNIVGSSHVKTVKTAVALYVQKLTGVRQKANKLADNLTKLLDLQDGGATVSTKQAKKVQDLLDRIIEYNLIEATGRDFAKSALEAAKSVDSRVDLPTIISWLKKARDFAKTVKSGVDAVRSALDTFG
ncbi:MAG: hypothetical protein AAGC92_11500 [Pseudomonadota bacterium]